MNAADQRCLWLLSGEGGESQSHRFEHRIRFMQWRDTQREIVTILRHRLGGTYMQLRRVKSSLVANKPYAVSQVGWTTR